MLCMGMSLKYNQQKTYATVVILCVDCLVQFKHEYWATHYHIFKVQQILEIDVVRNMTGGCTCKVQMAACYLAAVQAHNHNHELHTLPTLNKIAKLAHL